MSFWSPERVDELKRLWADSPRPSYIAAKMGTTRSSIISKIHRLKLPRSATNESRRKQAANFARRKHTEAPQDQQVALVDAPEPVDAPSGLPLLDTDNYPRQCRWPLWRDGDPSGEFRVCGEGTEFGNPYCAVHSRCGGTPQTGAKKREFVSRMG